MKTRHARIIRQYLQQGMATGYATYDPNMYHVKNRPDTLLRDEAFKHGHRRGTQRYLQELSPADQDAVREAYRLDHLPIVEHNLEMLHVKIEKLQQTVDHLV